MSDINVKSPKPHSIAQAKYDKEHTVGMYMKFNKSSDKDILQWLDEQPNKQGAIKELIRREIESCMNKQ